VIQAGDVAAGCRVAGGVIPVRGFPDSDVI
jgi:hypothetical protein